MQLAVRIHQRQFPFRCPAYANRTVSAAQPFDMIEFGHSVLLIHDAFLVAFAPIAPSIDDSDNGDGQGFTTVKVQISTFDRGQRLLGMLRASPPSAVHTTRYANCASSGARKSGKVRTLTAGVESSPQGTAQSQGVRLPRPSSRSAAPRGDSRTSSARGSRDSVAGEGRKQLAGASSSAPEEVSTPRMSRNSQSSAGACLGIGEHAATKRLKFPAFLSDFESVPGGHKIKYLRNFLYD